MLTEKQLEKFYKRITKTLPITEIETVYVPIRPEDIKASSGAYQVNFQHIYFSNGFAISAAMAFDGKEHRPTSTHGCLRSGYWCWKNTKERPQDIIQYIFQKIIKPFKKKYEYYDPFRT